MAIIAPIAAMVIQFAVSRQNEFVADRTGAEICGRPLALAGALGKLEAYARQIPMDVNPAAAQLAIVNPLSGSRGPGFTRLFSTHPSTEERIARLRELAQRPGVPRALRLTGEAKGVVNEDAKSAAVDPFGGRTLIILNPVAGQESPERLRRLIGGAFAARGAAFDLAATEFAGHATELAKRRRPPRLPRSLRRRR